MGDPRGFLKVARAKPKDLPVAERVESYREFTEAPSEAEIRAQASRCMDCGIPFCHSPVKGGGCPLGNLIPEWNDLVYKGRFDEAAARLQLTNNFPEVTSRVCPAPCEASCVLNIEGTPVAIKSIERAISDHVFSSDLVPRIPARKTGKRVAVVGSGPAGLAAAQELARDGHTVMVLERDDRIGGLLRYGIPDFKLEKNVLDRRMAQMEAEGVTFETRVNATAKSLRSDFDAVVLAMGARAARELPIEGRNLGGVHLAMEFLTQQNQRVAGDTIDESVSIVAKGKRVVVIGGGDTGSDCVGTSVRQGATSVVQLELLPKPPLVRAPENPWPAWPLVLRTSSSHEEASARSLDREFAVMTKRFTGAGRNVERLELVHVEMRGGKIEEVPGSAFEIPADLVFLAMGFVGPERAGLVADLGVELDGRGNVVSDALGRTSVPGVFAAGDVSRGQSLVVWAIADGRRVARGVSESLATPLTRIA